MRPSEALLKYRNEIVQIIAENNGCNPRVFGSVVAGLDTDQSDLDILIDPIPHLTSLMDIGTMQYAIQELLGLKVDVLTPMFLHEKFRQQVIAGARAL